MRTVFALFLILSLWAGNTIAKWGPIYRPDPDGQGEINYCFWSIQASGNGIAYGGGSWNTYKLKFDGTCNIIGHESTPSFVMKNNYSGAAGSDKLMHIEGDTLLPVFVLNGMPTWFWATTDLLFIDQQIYMALGDGIWSQDTLTHYNYDNTGGVIPPPAVENPPSFYGPGLFPISILRMARYTGQGQDVVYCSTQHGLIKWNRANGNTFSRVPQFEGRHLTSLLISGDTLVVGGYDTDDPIFCNNALYRYKISTDQMLDSLIEGQPLPPGNFNGADATTFIKINNVRYLAIGGYDMFAVLNWPDMSVKYCYDHEHSTIPYGGRVMSISQGADGYVWLATTQGATWWYAGSNPPKPPAQPKEEDVEISVNYDGLNLNGDPKAEVTICQKARPAGIQGFISAIDKPSGDTLYQCLGADSIWILDNRPLPLNYKIVLKNYNANNGFYSEALNLSVKCDITDFISSYRLYQNYPNPFNPQTTIAYDLLEDADVKLVVYDLLGRVVRVLVNSRQKAAIRSIVWDGTDRYGQKLPSGIYLYRLKAGKFVETKKMILMK